MMKSLVSFFLTANVTSEDYVIAKENMHQNNVLMLRVLSSIATTILLLCAVFGIFVPNMHSKMLMYVSGLLVSSAILLVSFFSKSDKLHSICMYVFDVLVLGIGLLITLVGAPEQLTVTLIPVALLVPLFFDTKPYRFSAVVILADLVYLIAAPIVKPADIIILDTVDVMVFSFAGILIGTILTKVKVERYVYAYNVERAAIYDNLTGLLNRRAYSSDTALLNNEYPDNFVYISLDVNGLKQANDTIGHAAGDEIIVGAADCMIHSFGAYGKVYRTGGDEYIAILYVAPERLLQILTSFEEDVVMWRGHLIDELSISYGYVTAKDIQGLSIHDVAVLADEKMYASKSEFYKQKGVDRRGQIEAHTVLCNLYTKILKINITTDTYQIISMDGSEQSKDKGFANKISEWLIGFGKSGLVHPDDLDGYLAQIDLSYMRDYFNQSKTSHIVFYRRKYGETYKKVMMEIIPAGDYTNDNQTLFLYVKNIDK